MWLPLTGLGVLLCLFFRHRRRRNETRMEALDFILNFTKDAPDRQLRDMNDLDTKVVQTFGAASVVIGLAGLSSVQATAKPIVIGLLADAVFSYVVVAGLAIWHQFAKHVNPGRYAATLWENFWDSPVQDIKHGLVDAISKAYKHNIEVLKGKALTSKLALLTTGVEVSLVAAALVISRLL